MAVSRTAAADSYMEVRLLVFSLANSFHQTSGGEQDEWIAEANLGFVEALRTYDPDVSAFTTWVSHVVTNHLLDVRRRRNRMKNTRQIPMSALRVEYEGDGWTVEADATFAAPSRSDFDWRDFASGLSDDAELIVRTLIETPREIARALDGKRDCRFRGVMRKFLKAMGWSYDRISQAYAEIEEAL